MEGQWLAWVGHHRVAELFAGELLPLSVRNNLQEGHIRTIKNTLIAIIFNNTHPFTFPFQADQ